MRVNNWYVLIIPKISLFLTLTLNPIPKHTPKPYKTLNSNPSDNAISSAISERADHLAIVAQFRDRETDHGQSRDRPNPENARNSGHANYRPPPTITVHHRPLPSTIVQYRPPPCSNGKIMLYDRFVDDNCSQQRSTAEFPTSW